MNNIRIILIGFSIAVLQIIGCGGGSDKSKDSSDPSVWLLDEFEGTGLERSSDIRTYKGESLYEYIDGGAELYHSYGFQEVATASYKLRDSEIVLDIYQFDTADNAYGLYSSVKPPGQGNVSLGIDGFSSENSLDFVKDRYLVHIVSFDRMESTMSAIKDLAGQLEIMIPGKTSLPDLFSLFPDENRVPGSEMIFSESFLGREFLNNVYSVEYSIDDTLFSLFLSEDEDGVKFLRLSNEEDILREDRSYYVENLPFDDGRSLAYEDTYRGVIIAGLKKGMLAGIIGYNKSQRDYFSRWLVSLNADE